MHIFLTTLAAITTVTSVVVVMAVAVAVRVVVIASRPVHVSTRVARTTTHIATRMAMRGTGMVILVTRVVPSTRVVLPVRVVEVIRRVVITIGFDKLGVIVAKGVFRLVAVLAIRAVAGLGGSNRGRRGAGRDLYRGGGVHSRGALAYNERSNGRSV